MGVCISLFSNIFGRPNRVLTFLILITNQFLCSSMYSLSQKKKTKAPIKVASAVTLALTLSNGERLIADFSPDMCLWDVLQHWEKENQLVPLLSASPTEIPICIYGRKEISTRKVLEETTLLQLGISSGKAAIRYSMRPDIPSKQLHVGGVLKPVARPPSPERPIQHVQKTESDELMEVEAPLTSVENVQEPRDYQEVEDHTLEHFDNKLMDTISNGKPDSTEGQHTVHYLNARGDLIYAMEDSSAPSKAVQEEESEDFFDLSVDELRKMMQDLQRQCGNLQNAPLLTSEQRKVQKELRRKDLLERYPTTILRIQFADAVILQVPLPSDMLLHDVKKEIVHHLQGASNVEDFFLYTSPPKSVLNLETSLFELGLTPSSVVYIGSNSRCCVLQHHLRKKMSSQLGAVRDATQRLLIKTTHSFSDAKQLEDNRTKRPAPSNSTNLPKWFKMKK